MDVPNLSSTCFHVTVGSSLCTFLWGQCRRREAASIGFHSTFTATGGKRSSYPCFHLRRLSSNIWLQHSMIAGSTPDFLRNGSLSLVVSQCRRERVRSTLSLASRPWKSPLCVFVTVTRVHNGALESSETSKKGNKEN